MSQMLYLSQVLLHLVVVSVSEASFEFIVHFHEFHNPLGLQCGECGSGGPPACCDEESNANATNCRNDAPYNCDTRFRFTLRSFGASIETAPNTRFPHYTPSNGNNSEKFNEGPGGFLALANPFTITNTKEWTGRVQFFIDALDKAVSASNLSETEVLINRFPIDLELELGAAFTERTTYTGIYNISGLGFDMSFRVQCSENYYGPNCATFCIPLKDIYNCSRKEGILCLEERRNPATNCSTCLPQFTGENCSGTESESDVALLAGTVGGAGAILIIILLMLCVVIMVVVKVKKKGKYYNTTMKEETYDDVSTKNSQTLQLQMKAATVDTSTAHDRDFDNPLYAEPVGKDSAMIEVKNRNQMQSSSTGPRRGVTAPMEYECPHNGQKQVDVLNPYYSEVGGKTDHGNASDSEQQNPVDDQGTRKNTFPCAMEEKSSVDSTANQTSPHKYHNVHSSCAVVPDAPDKEDTTITMTTHNEYDVIERCNTTSSTLPAEVPKSNDGAVFSNDSMASKPVEGEVYNVAYPVLTPKADSSAASVDSYESLSNVH